MKTLLSIVLCLALAHGAFAQETNSVPQTPKPNCSLCEAMLMIGCVVVGGIIVIYIYGKMSGNCCAHHTLVLEEDHYDGNWKPVATNITVISTNAMNVFTNQMTDEGARYRVVDKGCAPQQ